MRVFQGSTRVAKGSIRASKGFDKGFRSVQYRGLDSRHDKGRSRGMSSMFKDCRGILALRSYSDL